MKLIRRTHDLFAQNRAKQSHSLLIHLPASWYIMDSLLQSIGPG
jgi:hypothetical protein